MSGTGKTVKDGGKIKILVLGACGRMGKTVLSLLEQNDAAAATCGVDSRAEEYAAQSAPVPVYASFKAVREKADVIVDFSSARDVETRLKYAKENRMGIVLAPTGFTRADDETISFYAKYVPVFRAANLSLGANLLQNLCAIARTSLGEEFDAEIIEKHHRTKKDAPSGTALALAETLKNASAGDAFVSLGRSGERCVRKSGEIGIHAVRGGTFAGEHEVIFAGDDETLILTHVAASRKIFANGAVCAARFLAGKSAGLYGMNDLLAEKR
ncbi:MAG: 4-hydroxy-tetrahydrodipicolinate reductase [Candidatus Scatosoma sp.]